MIKCFYDCAPHHTTPHHTAPTSKELGDIQVSGRATKHLINPYKKKKRGGGKKITHLSFGWYQH